MQLDIDKLIGEKRAIGVGKLGFDFDGASDRINGVVCRADFAFGQLVAQIPVPSLHRQRLGASEFARDLRQVGLRQREHHADGLGLGDSDDTGYVACANQVAQLGRLQAQSPADGGRDFGVRKLQLGVVHLRLRGLNGCAELLHQRDLRVHLLFGDRVFRQQFFVAFYIDLGVLQLRLVFGQLALHLCQRDFKTARVDLRQDGACAHHLTFFKANVLQLAVHPCAYRGCIQSADVANGAEHHPYVLLAHSRDRHRLYSVGTAEATGIRRPCTSGTPGTTGG